MRDAKLEVVDVNQAAIFGGFVFRTFAAGGVLCLAPLELECYSQEPLPCFLYLLINTQLLVCVVFQTAKNP